MADEPHQPEHEKFEAPIEINFGNVCEGAMIEAFEIELKKVLANIADIATPALAKRTINLKVEFAPKEDRVQIMTAFSCNSKLAQLVPSVSRVFMAKDDQGNLYALKEDPRQMHIFSPPKIKEAPQPIQFRPAAGK